MLRFNIVWSKNMKNRSRSWPVENESSLGSTVREGFINARCLKRSYLRKKKTYIETTEV